MRDVDVRLLTATVIIAPPESRCTGETGVELAGLLGDVVVHLRRLYPELFAVDKEPSGQLGEPQPPSCDLKTAFGVCGSPSVVRDGVRWICSEHAEMRLMEPKPAPRRGAMCACGERGFISLADGVWLCEAHARAFPSPRHGSAAIQLACETGGCPNLASIHVCGECAK